MNPTDAYRKQIRKREIKRVSYRIQFFRNWEIIVLCRCLISIGFRCLISIGFKFLLFIVCFEGFKLSSGG